MSLLLEAIDTFSRTPSDQLAERVPDLPLLLLDRSLQINPLLEKRQDAIIALRRHIEEHNIAAGLWRNPEIYFPIFSLSDLAPDLDRVDQLLRLLRVHLGLDPLADADVPDGFYRLADLDGTLVCRRGESIQPYEGEWCLPSETGHPRVYLAVPGLFSDILRDFVPPRGYSRSNAPPDPRLATERYRQAYALMMAYDRELAAEFCRIVTTVALLPPLAEPSEPDDPALRWSYNLRFRYYGGIFVNPYLVDAFGLAEGMIHEYIHQRVWLWWMVDHPSGIPPVDSKILSPVTGAVRAGHVMFQALLVYTAALDFYRCMEDRTDAGPGISEWARRRMALLESALPVLAERLLKVIPLPRSSTLGRLVDWSMARV